MTFKTDKDKTDAYFAMIDDLELKNIDSGVLLKIIKIQAQRISELELDFQALGNNFHDLEEKFNLLERSK
jgi:hypothetical protein